MEYYNCSSLKSCFQHRAPACQFSPLDTRKLLKMCHLLPGVARSLQGVARLLSGCGRNTSCGTAHHMTHRSELKYQMLLLEGEHSSI